MKIRWLNEMKDALSHHGIRVICCEQGKKHVRLTITDGKAQGYLFTAMSPSDHRAIKNLVRSAKHMLVSSQAKLL